MIKGILILLGPMLIGWGGIILFLILDKSNDETVSNNRR